MNIDNTDNDTNELYHAYQYIACGLDNVFLIYGYKVTKKDENTFISISNLGDLHNEIAEYIIGSTSWLTGNHLKFLRSMLNMSIEELAIKLDINERHITDIENHNKFIPTAIDIMIRNLYITEKLSYMITDFNSERDNFIPRIDINNKNLYFIYKFNEWFLNTHYIDYQGNVCLYNTAIANKV